MRIAVINETSAADKNKDILAALDGREHEIINAGMTERGAEPELTYVHTGLLSAMLLERDHGRTPRVDALLKARLVGLAAGEQFETEMPASLGRVIHVVEQFDGRREHHESVPFPRVSQFDAVEGCLFELDLQ